MNRLEQSTVWPEYRVWHKPTRQMWPVCVLDFEQQIIHKLLPDEATNDEWNDSLSEPFDFADCVLMQYTGKVDQAGQKVYEGDVLRHDMTYFDPDDEEDQGPYSSYNLIFRHNNGLAVHQLGTLHSETAPEWLNSFGIFYLTSEKYQGQSLDMLRVGNIYEQPELLQLTDDYPLYHNAIKADEHVPA